MNNKSEAWAEVGSEIIKALDERIKEYTNEVDGLQKYCDTLIASIAELRGSISLIESMVANRQGGAAAPTGIFAPVESEPSTP